MCCDGSLSSSDCSKIKHDSSVSPSGLINKNCGALHWCPLFHFSSHEKHRPLALFSLASASVNLRNGVVWLSLWGAWSKVRLFEVGSLVMFDERFDVLGMEEIWFWDVGRGRGVVKLLGPAHVRCVFLSFASASLACPIADEMSGGFHNANSFCISGFNPDINQSNIASEGIPSTRLHNVSNCAWNSSTVPVCCNLNKVARWFS